VQLFASPGRTFDAEVELGVDEQLGAVTLDLVPELRKFITVSPLTFSSLDPGMPKRVKLAVAVPAGTPDALHEGTLKVRQGGTVPATLKISLEIDGTAPKVQIDAPLHLQTFGSSPVRVTGRLDDTKAVLTVNGVKVPIASTGTFSVDGIVLQEGGNTLVATAVDSAGNVGSDNVQVVLDSTAPKVTISSPSADEVLYASPIAVTGSIFDVVKGDVNPANASVQVNGIPAQVSSKTFSAVGVPLAAGANTIQVTAVDEVGNQSSTSISVTLDLSAQKRVSIVSGNLQQAPVEQPLPQPLVVALTNEDGTPAAGLSVIFKVVQNSGSLSGGMSSGPATAVVSGADGRAAASLKLGSTAGVGNNQVEVSAVGFPATALFVATGLAAAPDKINVGSGNNQKGATGSPLPKPFVAVVTDLGHNPLKDVPVTFKVAGGGGSFDGAPQIVIPTDSDGRATATLTLGAQAGSDNNIVDATFPGNAGNSAVFRASGLSIGDPGRTALGGVVLSTTDQPVPGVTLRIEGTTREAVTNANGFFLIENVPVGNVHLMVDGSTATIPGEFPLLSYDVDTVAGQTNTLPGPIYILPLDLANAQMVGPDKDVLYTLPSVPGFSLFVKAGSATFPNGSKQGLISVTQVTADKMPMEAPNGLQARFIVTIQPPGTVFDPPARFTLPNVDGYPPGHITEMYSFDHDLGQFVTIASGTVSADGRVIVSDPGQGIIKAGWHGGGDPAPPECVHSCPSCQMIQDPPCTCVADPALNDTCCESDGICAAGMCTPVVLKDAMVTANGNTPELNIPLDLMTGKASVSFATAITSMNCTEKFMWDFGDGATSMTKSPSHDYTAAGDFTAKLDAMCEKCGPKANDDVIVKVLQLDLSVSAPTLTLRMMNNLTATITPASAKVSKYKFEIRRASSGTWFPLQDTASSTFSDFAYVAGKFKLRVTADVSGVMVESMEKDLEVQFPSYADISGNAAVAAATAASFASTEAAATPTGRREEGFYVRFNTNTGNYEFTATEFGPVVGNLMGGSINLTPKPPDSPGSPTPLDKPTYTVASFHTHTPTAFRTVGRLVAPTAADQNADTADDLVGLVYDYVAVSGGSIPAGHPLGSAAQLYPSGPNRRMTPP
jgi:hypothetical protein